jgi:hypothetical protein
VIHRRTAASGLLSLCIVMGFVAYRIGRARADGVPMVNPLYYGGMLDDGGRPIEGARNVTVRLWDAATAGTTVCTTNAAGTAFSGGRFRVALDNACVGAVRANPELWSELQVDSTTFPRSKLGAVPYALEAGRASGAVGALEARLAAVEGRPTGGRQLVIGSWRPTNPLSADAIPLTCEARAGSIVLYRGTAEPLNLNFTASATSLYRVRLPRFVRTGARVTLVTSPSVPIQFELGNEGPSGELNDYNYDEAYMHFTAGQNYTLTTTIQIEQLN